MPNPKSFHAFTDGGRVLGGKITNFTVKRTVVTFEYEYPYDDVTVKGSFEGKHDDKATVQGEWTEHADKPINGEQDWTGSASLKAADEKRLHLYGTWSLSGGRGTEMWVVDAEKPKK